MSFLFFSLSFSGISFSGTIQCNPKSVRIKISIILNIRRGKGVPSPS